MSDYEKTAEPWIPLPPEEQVADEEPVPLCPTCGRLARRDLDTQQGWYCDIDGPCVPEFVYLSDEREDEE